MVYRGSFFGRCRNISRKQWKNAFVQTKIFCLAVIFILPFQLVVTKTFALTGENDKALPFVTLLLKKDVRDFITDVDTDDRVSESEITVDQYGRSIALTKLMIVFNLDTTPDQINKLLSSLNAVITASVAGTRSVVVRIPLPANLAAYDAIITQIMTTPYVAFVCEGVLPEMDALPLNYNLDGSGGQTRYSEIDHHLAIRAHAAWNIRGAIKSGQNTVVVADKFGRNSPDTNAFDYILKQGKFSMVMGFSVLLAESMMALKSLKVFIHRLLTSE